MRSKQNYAIARSWGEALRRRRESLRYTQEFVRVKAGLSRTSLSQYERAAILPNVILAHKLVTALDWTVEEWAAEAEKIEEDGSWYSRRFDEVKYGNRERNN